MLSFIAQSVLNSCQGGGHMAEGYARVTGKPGVLIVTSGPGATNAVTPMQDALMDGKISE